MLRAVIGWLNIQQRAACCVLLLAACCYLLNIQQRAVHAACCYWLAKYTASMLGSMLRAVIGWLNIQQNIQQRAACCVLLLAG